MYLYAIIQDRIGAQALKLSEWDGEVQMVFVVKYGPHLGDVTEIRHYP